eukprot:gene15610-18548_t
MFDVPEEVLVGVLVCVIIYLVKSIWFTTPPPPPVRKPRVTVEKRDYTLSELADFTGANDRPVCLAILGKIYDVSPKRATYGPGGGYAIFAGHDATRCLAKSSFETTDLNQMDTSSLTADEMESLNNWVSFFDERYEVVGRVKTAKSSPLAGAAISTDDTATETSTDKPTYEQRDYSLEELFNYNGTDPSKAIFVSLKGKIYDVSDKRAIYGPGGSYSVLSGRDVTACLAKNKLQESYANQMDTSSYTPEETAALNKWVTFYDTKYKVVGNIIESQ